MRCLALRRVHGAVRSDVGADQRSGQRRSPQARRDGSRATIRAFHISSASPPWGAFAGSSDELFVGMFLAHDAVLLCVSCRDVVGWGHLPREDRHGRGGGIVLEVAAPVPGERGLRCGDLALAAAAAELIGELHELRASGCADGVALRLQAAARVDRHAAVERGRPERNSAGPPPGSHSPSSSQTISSAGAAASCSSITSMSSGRIPA